MDARQFGFVHKVIVDAVHHVASATELLLVDVIDRTEIILVLERVEIGQLETRLNIG